MEKDNIYWFKLAAEAVADIVSERGGAIVMMRAELIEAVQRKDPRLQNCPTKMVFAHITCCLGRSNLVSRSYGGLDPSILLIFDATRVTRVQAREKCKRDGLSEDVRIALFERRKSAQLVNA